MPDSTVEELRKRSNFENKIASSYIDGDRVTVQARVAGRRESAPKDTPWVSISVGGRGERELFDSMDEMLDRYEELKDEYDLSE